MTNETLIKTIVHDDEVYQIYQHGDDDYALYATRGDWSVRGTYEEIQEELFNSCHPDIHDQIQSGAYDFLNDNEHLGSNIVLLGLGGSHAYGTNTPNSDIDIRGVSLNRKEDLIGMSHFETFVDNITDTTVYSVNKFFNLLMECNPNIVEMLGLNPEDYAVLTPIGKKILDNKDLFLSQKVYYSFGGYAYAQLKRLQNATARDSLSNEEREKHIMHSIEKQLENINKAFHMEGADIRLHIEDAVTEGHSKEIMMDGSFNNFPLRSFNTMYNAMNQVCKDYDHVDHRNRKKDDAHLNKHAMHLIRLYQMAIEILNGDSIHTKRTGESHELLMDIRNGKYMDGSIMTPEFFAMVDDYQGRLEEAFALTKLPKRPDMKRIEKLLIEINEDAISMEDYR